ncbi:MAG: AAA family ATPase [Treponema sp.]|nr:AAA family ATPase [Treponema sp.]MBQ2396376.1 AAA family ATPase [Bacteroidales bacterium]
MIARKIYLNQLISLCNQNIIKVITGIRRCGKSTLLSEFKDYLKTKGVEEDNILLLNFEEREYSDFARWEDVYDYILDKLSVEGMKYVFLDEVQRIANFEKLVDALFVKNDIDLYITGSNAFLLSSELGTLLS